MTERKLSGRGRDEKKVSFAEGLRRVAAKRIIGRLTERERAKFERERFEEEEASRKTFVLGRQIG